MRHTMLSRTCKYKMDSVSIVEDTEQTRFFPQMDKWMDWRTYE